MKLNNKKVAVLGFGMEGKDLVKYLLKKKADITMFDEKTKKDLDFTGIDTKKIRLELGKNYLSKGLNSYNIIFRSPGFYRYKSEIVKAEKSGVEISSAIKLFFELCSAKIIGVTGTKGKGTTASLIYEILKEGGKNVYLAGNIGRPILGLLPKLKSTSWIVLELSSFQLIDLTRSPHISVVLNVTEDHLDWHRDKEEYVKSKESIVKYQKHSDFSIINYDYKTPRQFGTIAKGKVYYFSRVSQVKGCYVSNRKIILNIENKREIVGDADKLILRGEHNWENVSAAVCASYLAESDTSSIKRATLAFKGLEHRLEFVNTVDGVSFYNDSFATGPQPTLAAVKSFEEPITLILGGYDKGLEYESMIRELVKTENLKSIILIGDMAEKLEKLLINNSYKGKLIKMKKPKMTRIVNTALKITHRGGVVLLSPAAASFDMFESYKDRGNKFKASVSKLR